MLGCMLPWATSPFIRLLSQERNLDLLPSAQDQNSFWLQSHRLQTSPIPKVDRVATGTHKHAESHSTTDANGRAKYTVVKHTSVNMQHHIVSQIQMDGHNTMLWNIQRWKRCKLTHARWIAHGKVSPWSLRRNGHHHNQQRQIKRQCQLWQGDLSPIEANFLRFHWKKRDTMRSAGMPTLKISSATNCIESMCTTGVELRHR